MTDRLTRIVTRTGDGGQTGLADGSRLPKNHPRIEVMGDIDELNSCIGLLLADLKAHGPLRAPADRVEAVLGEVQQDLFDLGASLSLPGQDLLRPNRLEALDTAIGEMNASLPPLREFVLPGGSHLLAITHLARTVARRAERHWVALALNEDGLSAGLQYLNRLSDFLFVAGRSLARVTATEERLWRGSPGGQRMAGEA
ncbi:MAG: Cobalamin adenosyltransferase [Pseudomonadota bacterium]|jgi:cob(I)alamin adenosyltransferase